ncbi:MAG: dephospho-CoA kinase [Thermoleophilia bacterium]|jgi:dephospho-CoA kinase
MRRQRIPRLGVTGGIGSGKSTALAYLREFGAAVISGDDIVHGLLLEAPIVAAIGAHFGVAVLSGENINRPALAALVFADDEALRWLEGLLHPHVKEAVAQWARQQESSPRPPALLAAEIPLLFETSMETVFDRVLMVTAAEEARRHRVAAKLTASEFSRRAARQLSEDEKARRSDFVYVNGGTRKFMKEYVAEVFAAMIAGPEESETLASETA